MTVRCRAVRMITNGRIGGTEINCTENTVICIFKFNFKNILMEAPINTGSDTDYSDYADDENILPVNILKFL